LPLSFYGHGHPYRAHPPLILTRCADCGFGTIVGREYHYQVQRKVLLIAWETTQLKPWHRAPGQRAEEVAYLASLAHTTSIEPMADQTATLTLILKDEVSAELKRIAEQIETTRSAAREAGRRLCARQDAAQLKRAARPFHVYNHLHGRRVEHSSLGQSIGKSAKDSGLLS